MAAMVAGIFAQSSVFGQLAVVAYGITAFIWNIASRTTFTLALLAMVATTLLLVVRGDVSQAQNFATYTFLLLVVGVISLIRELRKEGGRIYSSRKNIS
jgi:di/tricarboxylate transporter